MKTKLSQIFLVVAMLGTLSAHAVVRPFWERPILRAQLTEVDQAGHELGTGLEKSLTMNRMDLSQKPATSFTFNEQQKVFCVRAPCPPIPRKLEFKIVSSEKDGCGSTHYVAYEQTGMVNTRVGRRLEVVDHSTRLCDDYRKFRWEVQLQENSRLTRHLEGNPEGVITIQ